MTAQHLFPKLQKKKKNWDINETVKSGIQKAIVAAQNGSEHLHLKSKNAHQCTSGYITKLWHWKDHS